MQIRKPVVSGQFYPNDYESTVAEIEQALKYANRKIPEQLPDTIVAGIVPHAGWMFSGATAAMVFAAIKKRHERVDTFVVFGAAHSYYGKLPAAWSDGSWTSPLGDINIDNDLAELVISKELAADNPSAHRYEHSIEVQVPFIQYLFEDAKLLPIVTPPVEESVALGEGLGVIIKEQDKKGKKIVCIGSTDLTHYGPRYGFTPMGVGQQALEWASEVNDRYFINLALKLEPRNMLISAAEHSNACGAGAAAAAVAAAKQFGKTKGILLEHTNSNRIMAEKMDMQSSESVGYAAIIF